MTLRMLDLFAGIGGFSYAGEKLVGGYETVAFCEYDEHAQKVLRKHWPDTEIVGDIRDLANDAERFRGSVDIVCGGYPCQPFSLAGVRRGDQDDRHLWPEMLRVIEAVRPRWVIGENVAGHITMGLDTVLSDLEGAGYSSRCYEGWVRNRNRSTIRGRFRSCHCRHCRSFLAFLSCVICDNHANS